ncbi:MAG: glucose-6-phosphate isomerase [Verrucomicrobia bacterium]|nr:glucose-6-phosphate isomerase [Verrucomicrobiota bacterium]
MTNEQLWARFQKYYLDCPALGLAVDISRMNFPDDFFPSMEQRMQDAFAEMAALERGAIANPDENRMVGHYWLRNPARSPTLEIRTAIEITLADIRRFANLVHRGDIRGAGGSFRQLLIIGIGGSALGPQFVAHALGSPREDKMAVFFFDNTDPDGMDKVLAQLHGKLGTTLCLVISKSGGTKETRNGMLEAKAAYERAGLKFDSHAVAVTGKDSELDKYATSHGWIHRFPMWDWVGGRTSVLSAVGLLPAALQGIQIEELLAGASKCDEMTRVSSNTQNNPSALLSLAWFYSGNGKGIKDMVILPYKDRLELFSKYLQQLIMESLGKELDRSKRTVNQGIAVYGNKGSTDQHAYVQQLRDGLNNYFATFIEVLNDRANATEVIVDKDITSGDYLSGFFLGTRQALYDGGRESVTITIPKVCPFSVGVLIALYERAVGFYASLINVNAYHQPGVEAGKKAAESILKLQSNTMQFLKENSGRAFTVEQISTAINAPGTEEAIFKICEHLTANSIHRIGKSSTGTPAECSYQAI